MRAVARGLCFKAYYPCIGLSSHVKKRNTDILFSLPVSVLEVFSLVPCSDRRPVCFVRCRTPARKPDLSFRRIFGSSASKWFRCSFFTKQLKRQFNRFFLSVTAGTNNGLKTTLCSGAASVFSSPACRSADRNSGRGANENHWIREQFVLLGYGRLGRPLHTGKKLSCLLCGRRKPGDGDPFPLC